MRLGATVMAAAVLLAGCSSADEMDEQIAAEQGESAQGTLARRTAADAAPVEFTDNEEKGNAERTFSYSWPRQVSAIPALAAELEADRAEQLAEQKRQWADALEFCPPDAGACANNAYELGWQVVADLPRYLSLSNSLYMYTGGAHGNSMRGALVWDRETDEGIEPLAMFTSAAALDAAVGDQVCAMLNAEREKRRGGPVTGGGGWGEECVPIADATLFLGSSSGRAFDRLGVYYAPYVAGAYAEGDFEFTVPVSEQVLAAVKPEYRKAFARGD